MTFYLSAAIVTETEAQFFEREMRGSTINTAVVFPETVSHFVKEARDLAKGMNDTYDQALHTTADLSGNEAATQVDQLKKVKKQLKQNKQSLKAIFDEMRQYSKTAKKDVEIALKDGTGNSQLEYVQTGYSVIKQLYTDSKTQIDFQEIDHLIDVLKDKVKKKKQDSTESKKSQSDTGKTKRSQQDSPSDTAEQPSTTSEKTLPQTEQSTKESSEQTTDESTEKTNKESPKRPVSGSAKQDSDIQPPEEQTKPTEKDPVAAE